MPFPTTVLDPHSLSQGRIQAVADLVFGTPTGDAVTITSATSAIPLMKDKEFFEIRNNSNTVNNGLYQVDDAAPAANSTDVRKVSGADPVVEAVAENNDILCTLRTNITDGDWNNATGSTVDIVSAGAGFPTNLEIGSRFEILNHATAANNGVYEILSTVTNGYNCEKITGLDPADAAAEAVDMYSEQKSVFYDTAALGFWILEQPGVTVDAVADAVWGTPAGAVVTVTSAGANLPVVRIGQKVLVTDHITAANNGYYVVRSIPTVGSEWSIEMVSDGLTPAGAASDAINIQTDPAVDDTGSNGQPLYTRTMIDWNDDNFLRNNAGFPMFNIDSDAGKYLMGQNASGTNTGWNFVDNAEFGVRSRKLVRNMGWDEINASGLTTAIYAAIRSNATVEDNDRDLGYYQFGTDTTVDDTVDLEFAGPADEAIKVFDATVSRADDYAFAAAGDTITRVSGSWITDGYKVGSRVITANAENAANDGTRVVTAVAATILTVEEIDGTATSFTLNADDITATHTLDNRFAFSLKLRPRDDDALGKTFAQQGLGNALATQLSNRAFIFGLGTVEDSNIVVTDATIDGSGPYTGMGLTFHATPQARGAATLVGGARNFGIIGEANGGTAQQFYAFVQRELRKFVDIDDDGDTAIGRAIDGLLRFNGAVLETGSVDGGLTFPNNPDGGGSGFYVDNLAAADANNIKYFDNLSVLRSNKETIAITLDFNEILVNDLIAQADLYFDRTIRTAVGDLVVNAGGTITSAGANLPVLDEGAGAYIRLSTFSGAESDANGVYQVTVETSQSSWTVVRYDNQTMITTASASIPVDEHPFDTPSELIINTTNLIDATTISFTAPDTIGDTGVGLGIFSVGDVIRIEGAGAGANAGAIAKIATAAAGTLTIEQSQFDPVLVTQAAGSQVILTQIASIETSGDDFSFNFGFDDNIQGGRLVSTETFVKAKAIGRETAQYTESSVLSIVSGTPLTVPLQSQQERNVVL